MRTRMVMALLMAAGLCIGGAGVASAACVGGIPNGVVQAGEQCDDNNNQDCADACHNDCSFVTGCGDGHTCAPEVCDDANTNNADGCSNNCLSNNTCGNGSTDTAVGENCDDGNTISCDGCDANCKAAACGNGIVCPPEVCDDGNTVFCDGCNNLCNSNNSCGNGILDGSCGEECDNGSSGPAPNNAAGENCTDLCKCSKCGDSKVDLQNNGDTGSCPSGTNFDTETCDDGNTINNDGCANSCDSNNTCGNGVTDTATGETCDDANTNNCDACNNACHAPVCGDGFLCPNGPFFEICDDGDTNNGGACNANCTSNNTCGNGVTDTGVGEECDNKQPICVGGTAAGSSCASFAGTANCYGGGGICRPNGATSGPLCCDELFTTANLAGACAAFAAPASCATCPWGSQPTSTCAGTSCVVCNSDHNSGFVTNATGSCRTNCQAAGCGDGFVDKGETCDDGLGSGAPGPDLLDDADSCPNGPNSAAAGADCKLATVCGDGSPRIVDSSSRCLCETSSNPSFFAPGCPVNAGCTASGTPSACASGTEQCDAGGGFACASNTNAPAPKRCLEDPTITCTSDGPTCTCGNADTANHCRADNPPSTLRVACQTPKCGDGVTDAGEGCDHGAPADGGTNSNTVPGACRTNCAPASCGDGVVDTLQGEACDEGIGNGINKNCTDTCQCSSCTDGKLDTDPSATTPATCPGASNSAVEVCDDGNSVNTDACKNNCSANTCGDGIQNTQSCAPTDPPCTGNVCGAATEQCDPSSCGDNTGPANCSHGCCLYEAANIPADQPSSADALAALKCCLQELKQLMIDVNVGGLTKRVDKILKQIDKKLTSTNPKKRCGGVKSVARKIAQLARKIDQTGTPSGIQKQLQDHRARCARWANRFGNLNGCVPIF